MKKNILYIYMDSYIEILKNILKNNIDGFYDDIIKNLLFKIFDDYTRAGNFRQP